MRLWIAALAIACGGDGSTDTGPDDEPGDTDVPTASSDCASATIDVDGGTIVAEGATLELVAGSLVAPTELELCIADTVLSGNQSPVITVAPVGMEFGFPALLTVDHNGDEQQTQLFTPYWDGNPLRSMQATRPSPGSLSSPLYRTGDAWVTQDPRVTEPFSTSDNAVGDVLFVLDTAPSNSNSVFELQAEAPALWASLVASELDFHVGVVSMDLEAPSERGQLRSSAGVRWVQPDTPSGQSVLQDLLNAPSTGSEVGEGLGAAALALGPVLAKGANIDFQRFDASVAVVVLARQDDETDPKLVTPTLFADLLTELNQPYGAGRLHAIVSPAGTSYAGDAYLEVADITGGGATTIQGAGSMWSTFLDGVFDALGNDDGGLLLTDPAAPGTIQVWWVPTDEEPVKLQPQYIRYDPIDVEVFVEPQDFEPSEIVVLYEPEG